MILQGLVYTPTHMLKFKGGAYVHSDSDQFTMISDSVDIGGNAILKLKSHTDASDLPNTTVQVRTVKIIK